MKYRISISMIILASVATVISIPPPHPAVVAVGQAEDLLPPEQRSSALHNPHLRHTLGLTSLLHRGENPVFEREADNVPRREIYNILTHAGFIGRQHLRNQLSPKYPIHPHVFPPSHDSPFVFNSDALQYL